MLKLVVPLVLTLSLAACGGDDNHVGDPEDVAAFTYRERMITVEDAVTMWEEADTIDEAQAAAEAAANLVVGSGGPDYGDRDGNGNIDGDKEFGVLPGLDGTPPGLANAISDNECIVTDVLGGDWSEPGARWGELQTAVDAWTPDNDTISSLASQPMQIVAWAMLTQATDSLDEATEFAGRSQLNTASAISALDC